VVLQPSFEADVVLRKRTRHLIKKLIDKLPIALIDLIVTLIGGFLKVSGVFFLEAKIFGNDGYGNPTDFSLTTNVFDVAYIRKYSA
jgi:hypothetical protein